MSSSPNGYHHVIANQQSGRDGQTSFAHNMLTYSQALKVVHSTIKITRPSKDPPPLPRFKSPFSSRYSGMDHPPRPSSEPAARPVRTETQYPRSVRAKRSLPKHPGMRRNGWHCLTAVGRSSCSSWLAVELFEPKILEQHSPRYSVSRFPADYYTDVTLTGAAELQGSFPIFIPENPVDKAPIPAPADPAV
jgi:hypothetical protein